MKKARRVKEKEEKEVLFKMGEEMETVWESPPDTDGSVTQVFKDKKNIYGVGILEDSGNRLSVVDELTEEQLEQELKRRGLWDLYNTKQ